MNYLSLFALPSYDSDLRASHARTLLPAALASVPFGFVLVRVRVRIMMVTYIANGARVKICPGSCMKNEVKRTSPSLIRLPIF